MNPFLLLQFSCLLEKMASVDDAWGIINAPQGSECDSKIPQVETKTSLYHVGYDQRRTAQAKQDSACGGTVSAKVALPTWPPSTPVDRPPTSRRSVNPQAVPSEAAHPLPTPPLQAQAAQLAPIAAPETLGQRFTRCTKGIVYDLQNYSSVQPGNAEHKMMFILKKHDRLPVSMCLIMGFVLAALGMGAILFPGTKASQRQR